MAAKNVKKQTISETCIYCAGTGKRQYTTNADDCLWCNGTGVRTRNEQLMLCIGGPFNNKMKCARDVLGFGYFQYNCATRQQKFGRYGERTAPSAVYIHRSKLGLR